MEHWVRAKVGCIDIVAVDNRCSSRGEVELLEVIRYPTELGNRDNDGSVFGFIGGPSNYTLFLGTPRDRIVIEIDNEVLVEVKSSLLPA